MSERPEGDDGTPPESEAPPAPPPSTFRRCIATSALALGIGVAIYGLQRFGAGAQTLSMATTILTVGSLLWLTKRYGARSAPVLTLMGWVVAAAILLVLVLRN